MIMVYVTNINWKRLILKINYDDKYFALMEILLSNIFLYNNGIK